MIKLPLISRVGFSDLMKGRLFLEFNYYSQFYCCSSITLKPMLVECLVNLTQNIQFVEVGFRQGHLTEIVQSSNSI